MRSLILKTISITQAHNHKKILIIGLSTENLGQDYQFNELTRLVDYFHEKNGIGYLITSKRVCSNLITVFFFCKNCFLAFFIALKLFAKLV